MANPALASQNPELLLSVLGTHIDSPVDHDKGARIMFRTGEGAYLYDYNGKNYIDLVNGKGSIILGHRDPVVTQALVAYLEGSGDIVTGPSMPIVELADRIKADLGMDAKVSFFSTGTAACRAAASAMRLATGKKIVISAGYHGWDPMWNPVREPLEPNEEGVVDFYFIPELLEAALSRYKGNVAGIIFSPDYTYLSAGTLERIVSLCRSHGVLLCCDDVKQGYRHRKGASLELVTQETADLYVFSKGLSNGHRISCVVGRKDVMKQTREFTYTSYYQLAPVVAALATLSRMETETGYERIRTFSESLVRKLRTLLEASEMPIQVNGGPLFQFVFGDPHLEQAFYKEAVREGILLYEGDNNAVVRVSFDRFQDASEYLKTLTARIKVAYLWGDEYYLPYRKEAYQNIHSVHSYMVTGYDGATKSYYVQDWDGLYGYLEESHIQNAYDHLPDRYRNIEHLEYRSDGLRYNFQEDFELFLGWLRSFKDEGQYYRYAVEGASTLERQKLTAMEHGFAIIASSRYVFSKFLQYVNCDKRLVTEVLECHRFAKLIQTIIRRYLLSSVVDQSDLVDKIVDLEKRERSFIRDLRERYLT